MKIFYGFISAVVCFLSLSFICPPDLSGTGSPDIMAIASVNDIMSVDSLTKGGVSFETTSGVDNISVNRELTEVEISDIQKFIPVVMQNPDGTIPTTASEIIKYIISLLGGLLTSIILYFLHKKWPDIFTSARLRDYKKPPNNYNG